MDWDVKVFALVAGTICFLIYAWSAIAAIVAKPRQTATEAATTAKSMADAKTATAEDYSRLLEAASKLTDSLSKAGPTLVSLIGAILFYLIAAVSSGAFKSPPSPAAPSTPAHPASTTQ